MANKILDLLDKNFIYDFLRENALPLYPQFNGLRDDIVINPKKKNIWTDTYHVVFEYVCNFIDELDQVQTISIFCTAHDSEPREVVHDNLTILTDNNFSANHTLSPIPLFYSEKYNATFYQGIAGRTLYFYIKNDNREKVIEYVPQAARWFAKLHNLDIKNHAEKLKLQSIAQVVPGVDNVLRKISESNQELLPIYESIYDELTARENTFFFDKTNIRPIHGDAHSENIIIANQKYVAVIDFADMCLSDYARDLGSFSQQLEFKIMRITGDREYSEKAKSLFLENYLKSANIEMTDTLEKRIRTYYAFTQLRTATFFLVKHDPQPDRSIPLIKEVIKNLDLNIKL